MESEDDSRSSSNSSGSSNSSSNGPTSPPQEQENESNDQHETANNEHQSRSSSPDSNSFQEKQEITNQSMSPIREQNVSNENHLKDDEEEEELELSDIEDDSSKPKKADISHEDLSDISDLESNSPPPNFTDLRQKLDKQRLNGSGNKEGQEKTNDEDELDFEADEVREVSENNKKLTEVEEAVEKPPKEEGETKSDDEIESGEELEDGEVTDGDDKRPEESEPKAVCRFFTRGQCTWGMSCRFLHPGTTDKGNYTMFDMVRPIPVPQAVPRIIPIAYDYRHDRPPIHHIPPHAPFDHPRIPPVADSESAWDRGVRTAKEMIRKAKKRKEQDIDFDEKKMNLSGPVDEIEKDPYYVRGSPEPVPILSVKATPPFERAPIRERPRYDYSPPSKYARGGAGHFEEDAFGRVPRYRELPAHRMPHYEDDDLNKRRMVRSTREVIVEKADEWSDPWARKTTRRGSSGRDRARGKERSYSSNSSYSTSSGTSRSRSSSESSGSPSAPRRGRFESQRSKDRIIATQRKQIIRAKSRSSSVKRRHSPPVRPRTIEKKLASPIPSLKRKKPISPPLIRQERIRTSHSKKKRDSSSGSGSSSGSESDTSYSSSTSDSKGKKKREKIVVERKQPTSKVEINKKRVTPVKDDKKDKLSSEKAAAAAKIKSTRREELLKQLKAVEDAIARKKSKIN